MMQIPNPELGGYAWAQNMLKENGFDFLEHIEVINKFNTGIQKAAEEFKQKAIEGLYDN
jgi:hypothetical protein